MKKLKLFFFLLLIISAPLYAAKITNNDELIAAMRKKYEGKWYKTLTFVQKTTQFAPDGTPHVSTWYEALSAPGKLRIDFDPLDKGEGLMFADQMMHSFKDGKLDKSQALIHPLLVLGFDVYVQPEEKTKSQLKDLGFDLTTFHEDKLNNQDVYVIGAKQGDLKSAQFWIDKKNLLFVKMIKPAGKNKDHTQETQFNKYQKVKNGAWVSVQVTFLLDGKVSTTEEYSDIQTDVALNPNLYDTQNWMAADRTYFKKK